MTASRDPDRLIHAFLQEGEELLHDQVFDAVRGAIEQKRQRAFVGPWRTPLMNRFVTFGIGAAAIAVALFVGAQFLGSPRSGHGAQATPSSGPATPTGAAGLPLGQFPFSDGTIGEGGVPATVTIHAPGWSGEENSGILCHGKDCADPPAGAGMIGPWYGKLFVYGDPCHWASTKPRKPATTVDELIAAISRQASRDASEPVDITLDGYPGKKITLHVPDDADFSKCDRGYFGSWVDPVDAGSGTPSRYHQGPGQVDEVWIVDRGGVLTVIDGAYYDQTPASVVDEMQAIIESVKFE